MKDIQYAIIDNLQTADVIREEINRLLDNIAHLADSAALATSDALTDEMVSHGELMSTLLFVEVLRQRNANSQWFDVRKVMRTNDSFGRAEPELAQLKALSEQQLMPRLTESVVITQGFIGRDEKGHDHSWARWSDYTAALLAEVLNLSRVDIWTDVPGIYTTDPRRTECPTH